MNRKTIAKTIKTAHESIGKLQKQSLSHAIKAGDLLSQVNREVSDQPQFAAWCKDECGISYETASCYMRCYKNREKLPENLDYTSALRSLRKTRNPERRKEGRQLSSWEQSIKERAEQYKVRGNVDSLVQFLESFGIKEVKEEIKLQEAA